MEIPSIQMDDEELPFGRFISEPWLVSLLSEDTEDIEVPSKKPRLQPAEDIGSERPPLDAIKDSNILNTESQTRLQSEQDNVDVSSTEPSRLQSCLTSDGQLLLFNGFCSDPWSDLVPEDEENEFSEGLPSIPVDEQLLSDNDIVDFQAPSKKPRLQPAAENMGSERPTLDAIKDSHILNTEPQTRLLPAQDNVDVCSTEPSWLQSCLTPDEQLLLFNGFRSDPWSDLVPEAEENEFSEELPSISLDDELLLFDNNTVDFQAPSKKPSFQSTLSEKQPLNNLMVSSEMIPFEAVMDFDVPSNKKPSLLPAQEMGSKIMITQDAAKDFDIFNTEEEMSCEILLLPDVVNNVDVRSQERPLLLQENYLSTDNNFDVNSTELRLVQEEEEEFPPGLRFRPTGEELLVYYLSKRLNGGVIPSNAVKDFNVYSTEPWLLPGADMIHSGEEDSLYFFVPLKKVSENGSRPDRKTKQGFWRASIGDKLVTESLNPKRVIGYFKQLTYHRYTDEKKTCKSSLKTEWIMHEYRLTKSSDLVVCKIKRWHRKSFSTNEI